MKVLQCYITSTLTPGTSAFRGEAIQRGSQLLCILLFHRLAREQRHLPPELEITRKPGSIHVSKMLPSKRLGGQAQDKRSSY